MGQGNMRRASVLIPLSWEFHHYQAQTFQHDIIVETGYGGRCSVLILLADTSSNVDYFYPWSSQQILHIFGLGVYQRIYCTKKESGSGIVNISIYQVWDILLLWCWNSSFFNSMVGFFPTGWTLLKLFCWLWLEQLHQALFSFSGWNY